MAKVSFACEFSWHLVLKELLTPLIPSGKRVYKKSRSVESKSTPLSASKVGGHGETFKIVKENTILLLLFCQVQFLTEKKKKALLNPFFFYAGFKKKKKTEYVLV